MTDQQAQKLAQEASIKDPDNIYYVAYDDVMDSSSEIRWVNGIQYHYSEVDMKDGKPVIRR